MATNRAAVVCSHPPPSRIQWGGEGISTCSQEEVGSTFGLLGGPA